ncbi:SMP-30/gluconolactonase/LRE family protein [Microbacterium sp. ZW T5_56]|uniref:SMP-30/gluconolactonase/LRE family protein n=1 Tax=Microbacterium sp. ZW T5_56 TaxID=3378081 RepID=UPI0038544DD7
MNANTPQSTENPMRRRRRGRIARRVGVIAAAVVAAAVIAVAIVPSPIDAVAWAPAPAPAPSDDRSLSNPDTVTDAVAHAEFLAFDAEGQLYSGDETGSIFRTTFDQDDKPIATTTFATTEGRPNGLAFAPDGTLYVADIEKGLLAVDPEGNVTTLVDRDSPAKLLQANEVVVTAEGQVYVTDTTTYPSVSLVEVLEHRPHGRLLHYDPDTGTTEVLMTDLYFANGVTLSPNEDSLLVVETYSYDVLRYWLSGPRAGQQEVFAENLVGFADNITTNADGTYYLGMFTERVPLVDTLHTTPWLKNTMAKIPESVLNGMSAPTAAGVVVQLGADGSVVRTLADPAGDTFGVTTAVERDGWLYLGTAPGGSAGIHRVALAAKE